MKKLLFSLSLLATLATFAGESTIEATAQVFGVLPITSSATNVIVSVPWVAASNTSTNSISVAEIVKTANLTKGDWIRSWDGTNKRFNVWELKEQNDILVWEAVKTVTPSGTTDTADSTATFLERGDALILHRSNPGTSAAPNTFYVYGQYSSDSYKTITVAKGEMTAPAYTLLAPPGTTSLDLNNNVTWSNTSDNKIKGNALYDHIIYGEGTSTGGEYYYKYTDKKKNVGTWGYAHNGGHQPAESIPAGVGIWYVSRGGNPIVTWNYSK